MTTQNTQFQTPIIRALDQVRDAEKYVIVAVKAGKTQLFTSERDDTEAHNLVRMALPEMAT